MLPLRERVDDIAPLAKSFVEVHSMQYNKNIIGLSEEAIEVLKYYSWPGNVRELENLMERLVVLARNKATIERSDLPVEILNEGYNTTMNNACRFGNYKEARKEFEKEYILNVLKKACWNRIKAASMMNVHRNTLALKMKELNITDKRRKESPGIPKRSGNA